MYGIFCARTPLLIESPQNRTFVICMVWYGMVRQRRAYMWKATLGNAPVIISKERYISAIVWAGV